MRKIEFVDYDGDSPNLCSGTLFFRVDDVEYKIQYCMQSGGKCYIDYDGEEIVEAGEWSLSRALLKHFLEEEEIQELERQVNEHVPHGCCGGCL